MILGTSGWQEEEEQKEENRRRREIVKGRDSITLQAHRREGG